MIYGEKEGKKEIEEEGAREGGGVRERETQRQPFLQQQQQLEVNSGREI